MENIISFNFANWLTVSIMALLSFAIIGMLASLAKRGSGESANA